ncbi:MAG: STAS domain-containing protein [Acidimicrobiales bacterium]
MADLNKHTYAKWGVEDDGTSVVTLVGELDIASAEGVRADLQAAVDAASNGKVAVDVGGLAFIDSSGLALLVWVAKQVGSVVIRRPSPAIRRIVEVTGLETILRVED